MKLISSFMKGGGWKTMLFMLAPCIEVFKTILFGWQSWLETSDSLKLLFEIYSIYKEYKMNMEIYFMTGIGVIALVLVGFIAVKLWMKHLDTVRFKAKIIKLAQFEPPLPR